MAVAQVRTAPAPPSPPPPAARSTAGRSRPRAASSSAPDTAAVHHQAQRGDPRPEERLGGGVTALTHSAVNAPTVRIAPTARMSMGRMAILPARAARVAINRQGTRLSRRKEQPQRRGQSPAPGAAGQQQQRAVGVAVLGCRSGPAAAAARIQTNRQWAARKGGVNALIHAPAPPLRRGWADRLPCCPSPAAAPTRSGQQGSYNS